MMPICSLLDYSFPLILLGRGKEVEGRMPHSFVIELNLAEAVGNPSHAAWS